MSDSAIPTRPRRSVLVEALFPTVATAAASSTTLLEGSALGEEGAAIVKFAPSRRSEFITGRTCARDAMRALGLGPASIPVGSNREPIWPDDIVGSISHTSRNGRYFVTAVVARQKKTAPRIGIGIDAEVIRAMDEDVHRMILTDAEIEILDARPDADRELAAVRVFSAKEAFYKAQYAITGAWVGFHDMTMAAGGEALAPALEQTEPHEALSLIELPVVVHQVVHDSLVISGVTVTAKA